MCHRTWDEPALCSSLDRTACGCMSIQPSMLHWPYSGPQVWPVTNHIKAHCLMAPETVMGPAGLLPFCLQLLGMLPRPSTSVAMGDTEDSGYRIQTSEFCHGSASLSAGRSGACSALQGRPKCHGYCQVTVRKESSVCVDPARGLWLHHSGVPWPNSVESESYRAGGRSC